MIDSAAGTAIQQEALRMRTPDDSAAISHPVLRRLISPFEYRHLHASMAARFAGGGFQLGVGLVLLSLGNKADTDAERRKCYKFAAWFLAPAVLNLAGGLVDLTVVSDSPPRT
jgi:hypothetical protein